MPEEAERFKLANMPVKPLEQYIKFTGKGKFDNVIKRAAAIGAYITDEQTKAHRTCRLMQHHCFTHTMKHGAVFLQCCLITQPIMRELAKPNPDLEVFDDLGCGRYYREDGKLSFSYEYLNAAVANAMEERKIVFIIFDTMDYCVDENNGANQYIAHSTTAVFIPRKASYDCFYVNSHGRDLQRAMGFDVICSKRRLRRHRYKKPADVIFMRGLCDHLQSYRALRGDGNETICYDGTARYTYLGADLQAGDNKGICFAFPFILWYYFGLYYSQARTIETNFGRLTVPRGSTLLKQGRLGEFIEACFLDFYPDRRAVLVRAMGEDRAKATDELETSIAAGGIRFTKAVSRALVGFMSQSFFKERV